MDHCITYVYALLKSEIRSKTNDQNVRERERERKSKSIHLKVVAEKVLSNSHEKEGNDEKYMYEK